jgi:hypothetical protein
MKFCRNCHKFNAGAPLRCRYCRAGLAGRLCPRNHVNPVDPHVAFCGECGQPLERECGAGSGLARVVGITVGGFMLFIALVVILSSPRLQQQLFEMLIVLGLLIAGLRFAFGLLPSWARHLLASVTRALLNLTRGTGNKGKA